MSQLDFFLYPTLIFSILLFFTLAVVFFIRVIPYIATGLKVRYYLTEKFSKISSISTPEVKHKEELLSNFKKASEKYIIIYIKKHA